MLGGKGQHIMGKCRNRAEKRKHTLLHRSNRWMGHALVLDEATGSGHKEQGALVMVRAPGRKTLQCN